MSSLESAGRDGTKRAAEPGNGYRIPAEGIAVLLAAFLLAGGCASSAPTENGTFSRGTWVHSSRHLPFRNEISAVARRYAIPPALLMAIIHAESNFNPRAVSHKGAVGLMQLMPSTARWIAPDVSRKQLFDPAINVEVGARYLRYLADRYGGDARKVMIAWNAGPSRLDTGRIPNETKAFVRRVHGLYQIYAGA